MRALAPELVQPMSKLRAAILQASANPDEVAVFLFEGGQLRGPVAFSTIGMRIQNEQSGSSSLFAQPMALEPVPERQGTVNRDRGQRSRELETRRTGIRVHLLPQDSADDAGGADGGGAGGA